ncbi:MAG: hypothetical protein WC785_08510 [Tatlockia sp.]|jgi:hypothetical protein
MIENKEKNGYAERILPSLLFYEDHTEKITYETVGPLLLLLKSMGYKKIRFEPSFLEKDVDGEIAFYQQWIKHGEAPKAEALRILFYEKAKELDFVIESNDLPREDFVQVLQQVIREAYSPHDITNFPHFERFKHNLILTLSKDQTRSELLRALQSLVINEVYKDFIALPLTFNEHVAAVCQCFR